MKYVHGWLRFGWKITWYVISNCNTVNLWYPQKITRDSAHWFSLKPPSKKGNTYAECILYEIFCRCVFLSNMWTQGLSGRNKMILTILMWPPGTTVQIHWIHGYNCIGGYPARAFVMWKSGYWTGINNTYPLLSTRRVPAWSPMRALPAHSFPPLCSTSLLPSVGLTLFVAAICFKHWCKHCKTPSSPSTGAKLSKASSNLLNIE